MSYWRGPLAVMYGPKPPSERELLARARGLRERAREIMRGVVEEAVRIRVQEACAADGGHVLDDGKCLVCGLDLEYSP